MKKGLARLEAFLGDVGEAKQFTDQSSMKRLKSLTSQAGTKIWMAPEMKNPKLIQLGEDNEDNK